MSEPITIGGVVLVVSVVVVAVVVIGVILAVLSAYAKGFNH